MDLPINPPLKPMLAKATDGIPAPLDPPAFWFFEPKWDGFRCIVFIDGDTIVFGSRNQRPLTDYFPELHEPLREALPRRCVVDGELVVATDAGLDFDLLGQRIHPAASRIERLAAEIPATFVAFDLLALDDIDLRPQPFERRREALASLVLGDDDSLLLTPATTDPEVATDWFERFDGAGFDGVMAKRSDQPYQENVRAQTKVKRKRTADVVVAGYRPHKDGDGVGSLLLGVWDGDPAEGAHLHHLGVASAFSAARRKELIAELAPHALDDATGHPWAEWATPTDPTKKMPGAPSRWSGQRDSTWFPLDCRLVAEVAYEGMQDARRLRHPARFVRWRVDKDPGECRRDQFERAAPAELALFRRHDRG